ncbi:MAG: heme o synthase, partial [Halobacteriales archaeon]
MKQDRTTAWLAITLLATYVLIVVGATVSLREVAEACGGWPACSGGFAPPVDDPQALIGWLHRMAAAVTGLLVFGAAVRVRGDDVGRRVRLATYGALALYPLQVALGAFAALGAAETLTAVHLGLATVIFGLLVLALAWRLSTDEISIERGRKTAVAEASGAVDPAGDEAGDPGDLRTSGGWRSTARAYFSMTKPRLMWLLCLVALAGVGLAVATTGTRTSAATVAATLAGGCLAIGSSGTFNHVLERDRDRRMARTDDRPLATDTVPVSRALAFGVLLGIAALAVMAAYVNLVAMALTFVAIGFYSVVYTVVLKPNTTQNVVIGGAVGALPALIGWSAVTGSIGVPALMLGLLIFLWTPAHFYNLALVYREDYESAGFPMLPVVHGDAV